MQDMNVAVLHKPSGFKEGQKEVIGHSEEWTWFHLGAFKKGFVYDWCDIWVGPKEEGKVIPRMIEKQIWKTQVLNSVYFLNKDVTRQECSWLVMDDTLLPENLLLLLY